MPYVHRDELNAIIPMALGYGGGRIPNAPYPFWDSYGHGGHRFGVGALPWMQPGYGTNPSILRDGNWRRYQQRHLFPALNQMMYGGYGGGLGGGYGGGLGGALMPYGGYGPGMRRSSMYLPRRVRMSGYGVRGPGGRRWCGPSSHPLARFRQEPPLHVWRGSRDGPFISEDPFDAYWLQGLDDDEYEDWMDELEAERMGMCDYIC